MCRRPAGPEPAGDRAALPFKLTCEFAILRGPVRIEAAFEGGSLTYSQLSFEPGLPFGGGRPE